MKYTIGAVVVLGVILGGIALNKPVVYENPIQTITNEVIKEVNPIDEQIKQREEELEEKYSKIKSLEARRDVLVTERERLDAEIKQLTSDLAGFMTATTSGR